MVNQVNIEVAYAGPLRQIIIHLALKEGSKVVDAIQQSGIKEQFPEIVELVGRVGIFGKVVSLETTLKEGDRVEIYRELHKDPKELRRLRAKTQGVSSKRKTLSPLKKTVARLSITGLPLPGFK